MFRLCGHPLLCRNPETDFSAAMREKISNGEYLFERKEWENVSLQGRRNISVIILMIHYTKQ
ncbi:unnamed protein product [Anisakis simplex]|uniref:Uncharacterized protein n=1 Tax=Anisakis simplex TaxID=6269 RepID=A0A0M3JQ05_ANISI|nr:unnamed protein product [Anisakis simplex]